MKHFLILLIAISFGAFAQESNTEWDYNEDGGSEENKASLTFINAERLDDLLIKKKRRSTNKVRVFRTVSYTHLTLPTKA